jgi:hypothetical protein
MLERFDRDVPTKKLSRLCLCAGVNDIFSGATSFATVKASALAVISKATSLGIPVDIIMQPPQGSTRAGWSAGTVGVYKQFRGWLAGYAKANGFGFIDTFSASSGSASLLNVSDANLNPTSGMTDASFIHPSITAAILIGKQLASFHRTFVPHSNRLVSSNADGNLIANGVMNNGGSGTATGFTISNTSGSAVTTPSIAARTIAGDGDLAGNNQVLSIAFATAGDTVRFAAASIAASLSNGDSFRVSVHLKVTSGQSFIRGLHLYVLSQTVTTGNLQFYDLEYLSAFAGAFPDVIDGIAELECYVRSPQATHGAPQNVIVQVEATGHAAGTAVVEIGRFTVVKNL